MSIIKIGSENFVDLSGKRFGKLSVARIVVERANIYQWECLCDCGKSILLKTKQLTGDNNKSCGCLKLEQLLSRSTKHGMARSKEYDTWISIKKRCLNPDNKDYKYYGERGITMCDRWQDSFQNFYEDMGDRPSKTHSIDRIDNNKGYYKENCKWSTKSEQCRNQRNNRIVIINGESVCLAEAAERYGIRTKTVYDRVKRGWDPMVALTKPIKAGVKS